MEKNKHGGKYNRTRGHNAERKVVKELKELGFSGVTTSRQESKSADDNKIDIIDKNNQLPCFIQIKHTINVPQYFTIREQTTVPNEDFCII